MFSDIFNDVHWTMFVLVHVRCLFKFVCGERHRQSNQSYGKHSFENLNSGADAVLSLLDELDVVDSTMFVFV